ncbi:MAG: hypothetical protein QNI84_07950 [Henriciella sp.]|nr:hypothetical protein [Henriciella sp.]
MSLVTTMEAMASAWLGLPGITDIEVLTKKRKRIASGDDRLQFYRESILPIEDEEALGGAPGDTVYTHVANLALSLLFTGADADEELDAALAAIGAEHDRDWTYGGTCLDSQMAGVEFDDLDADDASDRAVEATLRLTVTYESSNPIL